MTMEVTSTDGSVTVEFPDGTPPEVIQRAMREALAKKQGAAPAAPSQIPQSPAQPAPAAQAAAPTGPSVGRQLLAGARDASVVTGATLGGVVGGTGGMFLGGPPGAAAGALGGAALGAAGGSLVFDSLNDAVETLGLEPLPGATPRQETALGNLSSRTQAAGREAMLETIFTGGFSLLFPVKHFLAPILGKALGVRNEGAKNMARLAEAQGVQLSAVDVGGVAPKALARILGVFPFIGAPLRKARVAKEAQLESRINGILNEVAPTSTLVGEVGIDMMKAAEESHAAFRKASGDLYDAFRTAARALPVAAVPTTETKEIIERFAVEIRAGQIPIRGGGDEPVQILKGGVSEDFERFLVEAQALPENLTYDQWARLKKQLEGFIAKENVDAFTVKRVAQIKQSMEADLQAIGANLPEGTLDSETLKGLRELKTQADTFFANGIMVFKTPTARKFGRVDKNAFRPGFDAPGTINADELLKPVFNTGSAQSLAELRSLVGDNAFRRAARAHLDDVFASSMKPELRGSETVEVFDLDTFQTKLGLIPGPKNRRQALNEMLRGTGVEASDVIQLVENARIAKLSDPAQFVARRVILGGAAAGASAVGLMAFDPSGGSTASAVAAILLARHGAKILADPKRLKALTAAFSPDLADVQKRALLLRVVRSIADEDKASKAPSNPPPSNRPGPAARVVQ